MSPHPDSSDAARPGELRVDRLLGRQVRARNGQRVGRLEEIRVQRHGTGWTVTEYVIGGAGLLERLGLGLKLLFGRDRTSAIARWDQLDISDPGGPRLTCAAEDLGRA